MAPGEAPKWSSAACCLVQPGGLAANQHRRTALPLQIHAWQGWLEVSSHCCVSNESRPCIELRTCRGERFSFLGLGCRVAASSQRRMGMCRRPRVGDGCRVWPNHCPGLLASKFPLLGWVYGWPEAGVPTVGVTDTSSLYRYIGHFLCSRRQFEIGDAAAQLRFLGGDRRGVSDSTTNTIAAALSDRDMASNPLSALTNACLSPEKL